ncbi:MAG: PH domain-containing protein [Chloroflexi bacterium]|nr:PH domain-containing protein [Chloroflexota bacterium]
MSYARNLLSRGEEVVYESRQHWFAVIARTWLWLLIALIALALVIFLVSGTEPVLGSPELDQIITIIAIIAIVLTVVLVGYVLWDWRNQEWLVTTRRVIRAEGVLNKSMSDSSLEKINDARLEQSLFGRIFGYGTLDILTAAEEIGGSTVADFPMIADPVDFKRAMLDQKEMLERPDLARPRYQRPGQAPEMHRAEPMPPRAGSDRVALRPEEEAGVGAAAEAAPVPQPDAATAPADPVRETLERLAGLRDRGLITPEEYEAKKRDILERM